MLIKVEVEYWNKPTLFEELSKSNFDYRELNQHESSLVSETIFLFGKGTKEKQLSCICCHLTKFNLIVLDCFWVIFQPICWMLLYHHIRKLTSVANNYGSSHFYFFCKRAYFFLQTFTTMVKMAKNISKWD